ncbi:MAG: hypothetical protein AB8G96_09655 [Phycisphaerales bacterium]
MHTSFRPLARTITARRQLFRWALASTLLTLLLSVAPIAFANWTGQQWHFGDEGGLFSRQPGLDVSITIAPPPWYATETVRTGLPFRSLQRRRLHPDDPPVQGGIWIRPSFAHHGELIEDVHAYRPIFAGWMANTAFAATLMVLGRAGHRAGRAWSRRERGRCVGCGHLISGAFHDPWTMTPSSGRPSPRPCLECGHPHEHPRPRRVATRALNCVDPGNAS